MITHADRPHTLYRFYDSTGALLYVGITSNLGSRIAVHAGKSRWFPEAVSIRLEQCADQREALNLERRAIAEEEPLHNDRLTVSSIRTGVKADLDHEPAAVLSCRRRATYRQREAAQMLGISPSYLSEIEKGTRNAGPSLLAKMAATYNCPLVVLERKRYVA